MMLADAQLLAIRKLLAPSRAASTFSPGPPLSKSHPSPSLLAKLYISITTLYSSASSLLRPSSANSEGDPIPSLSTYISANRSLTEALAHKWLGIDAGESGDPKRGGEAIAFLASAKKKLEDLGGGGKEGMKEALKIGKAKVGREERKEMKGRVGEELVMVDAFLKSYEKLNKTVRFGHSICL